MSSHGGRDVPTRSMVGFLVCPPEALIDDFVRRPAQLDPLLVRAVSKHLARCGPCREEADQKRRATDASGALRPWLWAIIGLAALVAAAVVFLRHELAAPPAGNATGRSDPGLTALARFDPPGAAAMALILSDQQASLSGPQSPMSAEDHRELRAARSSLDAGRPHDAAGLLEDLVARHPSRGGLRLLSAYAHARAGAYETALRQYAAADELGAGVDACWGLANAHLRLGDVAGARRELTEHMLARRPDDEPARILLNRISASDPWTPR